MAKDKPIGVTVVAVIQGIQGALGFLIGLVFLAGGSMFGSVMNGGFGMMGGFFGAFAAFLGIILIGAGALELVSAYGVWNLTSWGRILSTVMAALGLLSIPIGTILGIVIIYFLWFHEETKKAFK